MRTAKIVLCLAFIGEVGPYTSDLTTITIGGDGGSAQIRGILGFRDDCNK